MFGLHLGCVSIHYTTVVRQQKIPRMRQSIKNLPVQASRPPLAAGIKISSATVATLASPRCAPGPLKLMLVKKNSQEGKRSTKAPPKSGQRRGNSQKLSGRASPRSGQGGEYERGPSGLLMNDFPQSREGSIQSLSLGRRVVVERRWVISDQNTQSVPSADDPVCFVHLQLGALENGFG